MTHMNLPIFNLNEFSFTDAVSLKFSEISGSEHSGNLSECTRSHMPGLNMAHPKSPNILRDNIDLIILLLNRWDMDDYINSYNCCLDNLTNA